MRTARRTLALAAIGGLTLLAGCAWFEGGGPPDPALAPVTQFAERDSSLLRPGTADTTLAADSTGVADPGAVPADSLGAAADSAAADTAGVAGDAVRGVDQWELDGDTMTAETGPSGQVIRVVEPVITHDSLRVTARNGIYLVDQGLAELIDEVDFSDGELRGTSATAAYDRTSRILTAEGGVWVEEDSLQITGERGSYDRERGEIALFGNVRGERDHRRLYADRARWFRDREEILLTGGVRIEDTDDDALLTGERVLYDLVTDRAQVTETPRLVLTGGEGGRSVITGDRIWIDETGQAQASGNVAVRRGVIVAESDSATFDDEARIATLIGNPQVREPSGTLTGQRMVIHFDDDQAIRFVDMNGNASMRYAPLDTARVGELSTVSGDSLRMYFDDEGAERVVVSGNARSGYRPAPQSREAGVGTNSVQGDTISIHLGDEGVEKVTVRGNAKGVFTFTESRTDSAAADSAAVDSLAMEAGSVPDDPAGSDSLFAAGPAPEDSLAGADDAFPDSLAAIDDELGVLREINTATPSQQRVIYEADEVDFLIPDKEVLLTSNVDLDYGPLNLKAGSVRFYAERRYLEAEDDPVLVERPGAADEREVTGGRMDYNLDTREGTIDGGLTEAEDGFIYANRLRQVGEEQFLAKQGNFTSCDNVGHGEAAHFHFTSNRMRVYLDDKVVARPVTLYIRDIPIFAIPFYVFSIRKGRQSGFLTPDLNIGLGGTSGRSIRNVGYYWALSDYYDFMLSGSYTENNNRFVSRGLFNYHKRGLMRGTVDLRTALGDTREYDVVGSHSMSLGEWRLTGRAEFRDYQFRLEDPLSPDIGNRLDRQLVSDLSVSRSFGFGASFSSSISRRQDIDADPTFNSTTTVLQLPNYNFSLNSRTVGKLPDAAGKGGFLPFLANLRYSFRSNGSVVDTDRETLNFTDIDSIPGAVDTSIVRSDDTVSRANHVFSLSDTRKILGGINLSPNFQLNERWVDREFSPGDTTRGFQRAATWSAGISTSSTLYGQFPGIGPVTALRHVVRPSVGFSYQPEFSGLTFVDTAGVRRNRYPGISASESQFLNLSLDNNFQARVGDRRLDLVRWTLGASFDILEDRDGGRGWSDVRSTVDLSRIYGLALNFTSSHDPYEGLRADNYQLTAGYSLSGTLPGSDRSAAGGGRGYQTGLENSDDWENLGGDQSLGRGREVGVRGVSQRDLGWNAQFTFSLAGNRPFGGGAIEYTASINSRMGVQLTPNWSVEYLPRYGITDGELISETISLRRDLHCWEASFNRTRYGSETNFYFRINIKSLPDLKYEQGDNASGSGVLDSIDSILP